MAETSKTLERKYIIPLRKEWMKVPKYKRTSKGVKSIKEFVAKHMKVEDRDTKKVKLDVYLNNELWFRGCKNPPSKIKVVAKKTGGLVKVELLETPEIIKFLKKRQEKRHKKVAVKAKLKSKEKEEKKEKEKVEEEEKEKSVEKIHEKIAEQTTKAQKHTTKIHSSQIQRKALKK